MNGFTAIKMLPVYVYQRQRKIIHMSVQIWEMLNQELVKLYFPLFHAKLQHVPHACDLSLIDQSIRKTTTTYTEIYQVTD